MRKIILIGLLCTTIAFCNAQSNQLKYYLDLAIQNSALLADIQNQTKTNFYDSLLIRAATKPQMNSVSSGSYTPAIQGWTSNGSAASTMSYSSMFGVSYAIQNHRNLNTQFESLQLQNQTNTVNSMLNEQDIKRNVTAQYIVAYGSLQQLNFNREIIDFLKKEDQILKVLTQQNVYRQSDYMSFLVTLQQQDFFVKQLEIQFRNDISSLNYLCGIVDTEMPILQNPDIAPSALPDINHSVFFKQFDIDSLKLINNKTLIDLNYRPQLNVFAEGGFTISPYYYTNKNWGTNFGANLIIPIYDGRQRKLQHTKIDISNQTRVRYKSLFINQYQQQIEQLTSQLKSTESLITEINNQLKYTQGLIDVHGKLLEAGEVRIIDYLVVLNTYINAKNLIVQNNISRLQIINQLNYWNR